MSSDLNLYEIAKAQIERAFEDETKDARHRSVHSRITRISLVQVGYRRIEDDLDRADSELEKVSEGVALASVRNEIQAALNDFCDWKMTQ